MVSEKQIESLENFSKWRHLLFAANSLSELSKEQLPFIELRRSLGSLEEYFPRELNPLDDFPAYALRQFCKSLSKTLDSIEDHSISRVRT